MNYILLFTVRFGVDKTPCYLFESDLKTINYWSSKIEGNVVK